MSSASSHPSLPFTVMPFNIAALYAKPATVQSRDAEHVLAPRYRIKPLASYLHTPDDSDDSAEPDARRSRRIRKRVQHDDFEESNCSEDESFSGKLQKKIGVRPALATTDDVLKTAALLLSLKYGA